MAADGTNCTASECNYSVPLDKPGFYTITVTLPAGQKAGVYNLLIDPSTPYEQAPFVNLANGFHGGGLLKEGGQSSSWVGFSLAQFEPVNISVYNHSNPAVPLDLILTNSSRPEQTLLKFGPILTAHGQIYTSPILEPGFYVASVNGQPSLPLTAYSISVGGSSVFGGVSGGWLDSNNVGWGAFYATQPRTVNLRVQFGSVFGDMGTGQLFPQVYFTKPDGSRELYWAAANFAEQEPNDQRSQATPIATYPWSVSGVLQTDNDEDYFKFAGKKGDIISVVITKTDPNFKPMLSIEKATGKPLRDVNFNPDTEDTESDKFSAQLTDTSDFYLLVTDKNGRGASTFNYTVNIFIDSDVDGLPDNLEPTLGLTNSSSDSDNDGILDGVEAKGNKDADGDGLPNWLDLDSDNDGIPDQQEGSTDPDGDGLGNFVDTDSDNNGIVDQTEAGADPKQPQDFDNNGIPDYADIDDDNDGLIDSKDNNRVEPIASSDILDLANRVYLESTTVTFGDKVLTDTARAGDTLILKGAGFAPTASENIIIFNDAEAQPINATPIAATATELTVVLPEGAGSRVAVVARGQRSNWLGIKLLPKNAPLLLEADKFIVKIGEKLTLTGLNLANVTNVYFDTINASVSQATDTSVEVTVPAQAVSGQVTVADAKALSNPLSVKVTREIPAKIVLPTGSTVNVTGLTVSFGPVGEAIPDANGNVKIEVNNSDMDMVYAMLPESGNQPISVFLQAVTLPGDTSLTLDSLSTAVAMTMMGVAFGEHADMVLLGKVRTAISSLPEVITASSILRELLKTDPYFFNNPLSLSAQSYYQSLQSAYQAAQKIITTLQPATRYGLREATKQQKPEILQEEEQYGIKLYPVVKDNMGNIGVDNHTQLYLSAKFIDTQDKELSPHISGYSDSNMIGPAGGLFLGFWSAKKDDYGLPKGKDCKVEVVTPGTIFPPNPPRDVWKYLALRTFVEQMLVPPISFAIGLRKNDSNPLVDALTQALTAYGLGGFFGYLDKGDVNGAFMVIINMLSNEVQGVLKRQIDLPQTTILKAIIEVTAKELAGKAVELLIKKIAPKLVPGVGQISTALDALNTGTTFGLTAYAFGHTPGLIKFEVKWPLRVEEVTPEIIQKKSEPKEITINGNGFAPVEGKSPKIIVTDTGGKAKDLTLDPTAGSISSDGTKMTFTLPANFRNTAAGPKITVKVTHKDQEDSGEFEITSDLKITKLLPDSGTDGTAVTIRGVGFDTQNLANNIVNFAGGQAKVVSASESELHVIAPNGVQTGGVTVTVGNKTSNSLPFTVETECNEGANAGGSESDSRSIYLGRKSGSFSFSYQTYSAEDRIVVQYEGGTLLDTGCVGRSGYETLSYSGESKSITVTVTAKCAGDSSTQWNYTVGCPSNDAPKPKPPTTSSNGGNSSSTSTTDSTPKPPTPPVDEVPTPPTDQGPTPPTDQGPTPPTDQEPTPPTDQEPTPPTDQEPTPPTDQEPTPPTDQEPTPPTDQEPTPEPGTGIVIETPEALVDFKATPQSDNSIQFEWTTAFETNLTGFKLWQAAPVDGSCLNVTAQDPITQLTENMIVAKGIGSLYPPFESKLALPNQCYGLELLWVAGDSSIYVIGPGITPNQKWRKELLPKPLFNP